NFALVLVAWLLYRASFAEAGFPKKLFYFLPVPFLLFQMHLWEFAVWATVAENLYILFFSLLSFYAIKRATETRDSKGKRANKGDGSFSVPWLTIACSSAVAATFTNANGIFVFLVGIPAWLVAKQYRQLGTWIAVGAITAVVYFWGYQKPPHHPQVVGTLFEAPWRF